MVSHGFYRTLKDFKRFEKTSKYCALQPLCSKSVHFPLCSLLRPSSAPQPPMQEIDQFSSPVFVLRPAPFTPDGQRTREYAQGMRKVCVESGKGIAASLHQLCERAACG